MQVFIAFLVIAAIVAAEAKKKRSEIDGFGGYKNYAQSQAIENGLNPFQPTYIVPGTKP